MREVLRAQARGNSLLSRNDGQVDEPVVYLTEAQ
jgi:hypothetical protein